MHRSIRLAAAAAAAGLTFAGTALAGTPPEPQAAASCPSVSTTAPFTPPGGGPTITVNVVKPVVTQVLPGETCDNYPYIPVWADQPTTIPFGSTTRVWYWIEQGHPGGTCFQEGGWGFDRQITLDGNGSYGSSSAPIGTTVGPFNQAGSFTFTVVCPQSAYGPGNQNTVTITVASSPPPPPPPPPPSGSDPTVTLAADPNPPKEGDTTTLSWSSTNVAANGCAVTSTPSNGSWSSLPTSGSVTTPVFRQVGGYAYSISCRGVNGKSAQASVSFTVGAVWASDYTVGFDETLYDTSGRVLQSSSSGEFPAGTLLGDSDGSSSGCRKISPHYNKPDLFHLYTTWRYVHYFGWCWKNKTITQVALDAAQFEGQSVYDAVVNYENSSSGAYYFTWKNQAKGGYFSDRHGSISNCVFHFGCLSTNYPFVDIAVYGNGTWQAKVGEN